MIKNNEEGTVKLVSFGGSLEIDLSLAMNDQQYKNIGIDFPNINSLTELKPLFQSGGQAIINLISLTSEAFLFNSLMYINRANKVKTFIELLLPFEPFFEEEKEFFRSVIKSVIEKNFVFVEYFPLLKINPKITFTLKLLDIQENKIDSKQFIITDKCKDPVNYYGDLYSGLHFEYDANFFYSTIPDLLISKLNSYDEIESFLSHICHSFPNMIITLNFSNYSETSEGIEPEVINSITDIVKYTDIFIFEKGEVKDYFSLVNEEDQAKTSRGGTHKSTNVESCFISEIPQKKNQKIKIGLFVDELKTISIVQQEPKSQLVLFHTKYTIDFIPKNIPDGDQEEYQKLIKANYTLIKSIFISGFLSRLFNKKSFTTCFTAGNELVKRVIDLIRFNFEFPTGQNYYEILVPKGKKKGEQIVNPFNLKKENHFVLDCTNLITSKKRDYNPLYDSMCCSFFSSDSNRRHLVKMGFINKKGYILADPGKRLVNYYGDKKLVQTFESERNRLMKIKEKNELLKLKMRNLSKVENFKNQDQDNLAEMANVYNFDRMINRKLPSVKKPKRKNHSQEKFLQYKDNPYFKEIKDSKFLKEKKFKNSKTFRTSLASINTSKNEDYIVDKNEFKNFLDGYEKKLKEKENLSS